MKMSEGSPAERSPFIAVTTPTRSLHTRPSSTRSSKTTTTRPRPTPTPSYLATPTRRSRSSESNSSGALDQPEGSPTPSVFFRSPSSLSSQTNGSVTNVKDIASGISLRHGISSDRLRLLSVNPPETRLTNIACTGKDTSGRPVIRDVETGEEVLRHPDLWLDDGSVVCRAENTLFCVHMSQLARHSLCFRDMFMLPQSEASQLAASLMVDDAAGMTTQGFVGVGAKRIPVIYLYDKAEDVANLLTALYDGPAFGDNGEEDFRVVSGVLRLSTKYLIDSLRAKALAHLCVAWPNDLKAWDAREDLARAYEMDGAPKDKGGHRYPHPLEVIALAREVDAPMLLPSAFYDLSRSSFAQILEEDPLYCSQLPRLSLGDMHRLCLGKETAQHSVTTLIQGMGNGQNLRSGGLSTSTSYASPNHHRKSSGGGVCVSAAACRKDFSELVDLATQHYLFDRERGWSDPLYVAEELGQLKSAEFSECKACARSLEAWAAKEREKIWKMVPIWFRLAGGGERRAATTS